MIPLASFPMPIRKAPKQGKNSIKVQPKDIPTVKVTLRLPNPHERQYELINAFEIYKDRGVRFVIGACGTKGTSPKVSL